MRELIPLLARRFFQEAKMSVRREGRLVACVFGVTFGAVGVTAGPAAAGRITAGWPLRSRPISSGLDKVTPDRLTPW